MKKIITLLLAIVTFITLFSVQAAVAAPPTPEGSVVVYHPIKEKTFAVGKDVLSFKSFTNAASKDTSADFSVVEITNAPRYKGLLLEKHVIDVPEDFYAISGEYEFFGFQPDKTLKIKSGDIIHIPAGVPYGYKNAGDEPGKILLITTSKEFENFIEEIGTSVTDKSSISSNSVQLDMEKVASVARKHGIEFFN